VLSKYNDLNLVHFRVDTCNGENHVAVAAADNHVAVTFPLLILLTRLVWM